MDRAIKFNVKVEGLGAIGDSTTCQKSLDDTDVLIEKAAWLEFKNSPGDRWMKNDWRDNLAYQVKVAHRRLKAKEMALFEGHKSYFRWLEGRIFTAPAPDDYIVASDSEDENLQSAGGPLSETPSKKPKKTRRTPLPNLPLTNVKGKGKAVDLGSPESVRDPDDEETLEEDIQVAIQKSLQGTRDEGESSGSNNMETDIGDKA